MDWNTEKVVNDLPRIRRLKGVAKADLEGNYLYIRTKNLRHPGQWYGLADIEIKIPLSEGESYMRYLNPKSYVLNSHPSIGLGIGKYQYRSCCIGNNKYDYQGARAFSPYMTVLQQLAMLQTIKRDEQHSQYYKTLDKKIMSIMPGVMVAVVVAFYIFLIVSIN